MIMCESSFVVWDWFELVPFKRVIEVLMELSPPRNTGRKLGELLKSLSWVVKLARPPNRKNNIKGQTLSLPNYSRRGTSNKIT